MPELLFAALFALLALELASSSRLVSRSLDPLWDERSRWGWEDLDDEDRPRFELAIRVVSAAIAAMTSAGFAMAAL